MRSQSQTIEVAQGLARAIHSREASLSAAVATFEQAPTPELRAKAGESLIHRAAEAEITFNSEVAIATEKASRGSDALVAVGSAMFGKRGPGA